LKRDGWRNDIPLKRNPAIPSAITVNAMGEYQDMTRDEVALVWQGYDRIAPQAEAIGVAIYQQLFALDPSLRAMFGPDMRVHARNPMGAVGAVVRSLDNLAPILAYIQMLGRRLRVPTRTLSPSGGGAGAALCRRRL
jgi:hypothetical protein